MPVRLRTFTLIAGTVLCGCAGPQPFALDSSADAVEIAHGGDLAGAAALARSHCAGYERTARLRRSDTETATFDCIKR
jgi:hypothetical protein